MNPTVSIMLIRFSHFQKVPDEELSRNCEILFDILDANADSKKGRSTVWSLQLLMLLLSPVSTSKAVLSQEHTWSCTDLHHTAPVVWFGVAQAWILLRMCAYEAHAHMRSWSDTCGTEQNFSVKLGTDLHWSKSTRAEAATSRYVVQIKLHFCFAC